MWKDYFGPQAKIYGVDINPECKKFEEENISIYIGSQSDPAFLNKLKEEIPPFDILIDDGGHYMSQQIISFEHLYDHIKPNGVYLCEDLHTSYFLEYGGGHKRRGTFIEHSKNFIDWLNAWHSEQRSLKENEFTYSADSIHYYVSMVVVEKRKKEKPRSDKKGNEGLEMNAGSSPSSPMVNKLKRFILKTINQVLRALNLKGFRWY